MAERSERHLPAAALLSDSQRSLMCNKAAAGAETFRFRLKGPFIHILTDPEQQTQEAFPLVALKLV